MRESYDIGNQDAAPHSPNNWLDIWWPALVIAFGLLFTALICGFHPRI